MCSGVGNSLYGGTVGGLGTYGPRIKHNKTIVVKDVILLSPKSLSELYGILLIITDSINTY